MKLDGITRSINMNVLKAKKNSPHIFFGIGLVGTVVSTVLACRATLKLEDWIDETTPIVKKTKELNAAGETELARQSAIAGGKQVIKLGKMYAPAVGVHIVSVACLSGAHVTLARRNAALTALVGAAHQGYVRYQEAVTEEIGKDKNAEIHREISLVDKREWNSFTRFFDETSTNFHKDAEINREFLHFIQQKANNLLRAKGVVYLNEVYEMLGFEPTRMGRHFGWVYGGDGINEIDFGIFEPGNEMFINSLERVVVLNFNVDGQVSDFI